jgi:hypothetical protein
MKVDILRTEEINFKIWTKRVKTSIFLKTGIKFRQHDLITRRSSAGSRHVCSQSKNKLGALPSRIPELTINVDH